MTRSLFLLPGLVLSIGFTCGCERENQSTVATQKVNVDACAAALASGAEDSDLDQAIVRHQQQARAAASKDALERLGYAYVARARVSNDAGDYTLAEKTAECLDSRYPGESLGLLLKGHVLHQLHRFAEAEQIGRQLVARRTFVLDYGLLGDALMEQGRLTEAATAYQKMMVSSRFTSPTRALRTCAG
jgi:tetratricopeptide (TPR) repeat protein